MTLVSGVLGGEKIKKLIIALSTVAMIATCAGCHYEGYDFFDTNYHFDRAIMRMPDGEIVEVKIEKWADADGEQLTITGKNGKRYLVSSINCVLIED